MRVNVDGGMQNENAKESTETNRKIVDKVNDSMYNYFKDRGGRNDEISQEFDSKYSKQNNMLVDGRRCLKDEELYSEVFFYARNNYDILCNVK